MFKTILLAFSIMLSGCATAGPLPTDTAAQNISKLTTADLTAAAAISTANGDTVGANCANALNTWLTSLAPAGEPTAQPAVVGPASAFAEARVHVRAAQTVVSQIKAGVPEAVHIACSPVVVDANSLLIQLGLIAGGAKVLAPLAP